MRSASNSTLRRAAPAVLFGALIVAMVIVHVQTVRFVCDDAYISFRYARNLASGHGPVYNPGERVEGYTNFLWMVLIAAAMRVGATAEGASFALGIFFLILTMAGTALAARRLLRGGPAWALLPCFFLATLGPVVLWSVCGLETIFFTAAVLAAFLQYHRAGRTPSGLFAAGLLYGVAALVRPEGTLFGAAAGIHLAGGLFRRDGEKSAALIRRAAALAGGFAVLFLPFLLWRYSYYGDWLPNTFYVKTAGTGRFALGARYLLSFAAEYPALVALAAAGIPAGLAAARGSASRSLVIHMTVLLALMHLYIAWAGGDYMALYRFHVPLLPFAALLAAAALRGAADVLQRLAPRRAPQAAAAVAVAAALLGAAFFAPSLASARGEKRSDAVVPLRTMKRNTALWVAAGKALGEHVWADAVIATPAAGAIPYYSALATIDQSGLNDRHTARVEWEPWIADKPGHGKIATKQYILERSPDIIVGHPRIAAPGALATPRTVWPRYVIRGIPITPDEEDLPGDLMLWFWLRVELLERGEERGFAVPAPPEAAPR